MAYQTGASAGCVDLLNKLRIFSEANGWTTDKNTLSSAGGFLTMHNPKGDYITYCFDGASWIYSAASTGFSNTAAWDQMPGTSATVRTDLTASGFPTYWLFGDADGVMVVVEKATGQFRHFGCGNLVKNGAYTGGFWMTATHFSDWQQYYNKFPFDGNPHPNDSRPSTEVRCQVEGNVWYTGLQHAAGLSPSAAYLDEPRAAWNMRIGGEDQVFYRSPNVANALTLLGTIRCMVSRAQSGIYSHIGSVKDIRFLNLELLSPKDEIVLGTDTWMVFPISVKAPQSNNPFVAGSDMYGIAYRRVP